MNPNKIFLVQKGEIEGRFDVKYYSVSQLNWNKKFDVFEIKYLLSRKQIQFDSTELNEESFITLSLKGEIKPKLIKEWRTLKETLFKARFFKAEEGNFIFSKIDFRNGAFSIVPKGRTIAITSEFPIYEVGDKILGDFLVLVLKFNQVLDYLDKRSVGHTGRKRTEIQIFENLKIPVPPLEIQAQIVAQFEAAYAQKRAKEAEAKTLLAGIDEYLLNALGIRLPEPAEKKKFFYVRASQVSGGRLDAPFYSHKLSLETLKFDMVRLSDHVLINPKTSFPVNLKVSFVPMEAVNRNGYMETLQDETSNNSKGYTSFKEKDLIWAKITPCMENGKSAIAQNLLNGLGFGSTEFHVFRVNSPKILIDYLFELFRTKHFREIARKQFGGSSGHQRVPPSFFKNLLIPFPPLAVQTEIAEHIRMIRAQAKQLKQEAKEIIERAKQEVEAMILGS